MNSRSEVVRAPEATATPVVLFDGWCPMCAGTVRFVLKTDRDGLFRFAPLDSPAARALLERCASEPSSLDDVRSGTTVALVLHGRLHTRTDAAWRIAAGLPFPWRALSALRLVPRALRDRVYASIARRRHRVWGRLGSCYVPESRDRDRFL